LGIDLQRKTGITRQYQCGSAAWSDSPGAAQ
jgi:hypothetical protein